MKTDPTPTPTPTPTSTPAPGSTADGTYAAVADHETWMALGRDAYQRLADAFAGLETEDWERPTPCEGWTVRDLGGHIVGAMRSAARFRELASQQREIKARAKRTGENEVDVMTAVQIARTEDLTTGQLVAEMQSLVGPAVRGRARMPGFLRRAAKLHVVIGSIDEKWSLDYLLGRILTRDAWLHRVDLADSTGRALQLDEHDRTIVGDVAVEWAQRHGQDVDLVLTGPAGGRLRVGAAGPRVELDAVEFCRVVSGRAAHDHPLLSQEVPF